MIWITLALMVLLLLLFVWDVAAYRLPNQLIFMVAMLYAPYVWLMHVPLHTALINFGVCIGVMMLGMILFSLKLFGGGDAKFLAVCTLWAGLSNLAEYMIYVALIGGALTIALLVLRPVVHMLPISGNKLPMLFQRRAPIPYGVAISAALLILIYSGKIAGLALS